MTDLTLNEYRGIPKEKLKHVLRDEAQKMRGPDPPRNIKDDKVLFPFNPLRVLRGFSRRIIRSA
jgi:hypothetical protein